MSKDKKKKKRVKTYPEYSEALTKYAVAIAKQEERSYKHRILLTTDTRGGDFHLNGTSTVRMHPRLISDGQALLPIIKRIFLLIDEKKNAVEKDRTAHIAAAQSTITPTLSYLQRTMTYEDFMCWLQEQVLPKGES